MLKALNTKPRICVIPDAEPHQHLNPACSRSEIYSEASLRGMESTCIDSPRQRRPLRADIFSLSNFGGGRYKRNTISRQRNDARQ